MLAGNNIICHFIRINRYGDSNDGDDYDDSNNDRGWSSNRPFFISHILEDRKRKKEKLSEHCGRLKDDVLCYWKNERSGLAASLGNTSSYPKSPIPLYVDIWSRLTQPIHFNQLSSKLLHR
jgi:hypothetical protein